jgi:hypothetical protein
MSYQNDCNKQFLTNDEIKRFGRQLIMPEFGVDGIIIHSFDSYNCKVTINI